MRKYLLALVALLAPLTAGAQTDTDVFNQMEPDGTTTRRTARPDSLGSHKEIPHGLDVWTEVRRFGDRRPAQPDTLSAGFMNTIFTTGRRGEYNTTGNLGAPRLARIFIDRRTVDEPYDEQFIFAQPFSFFLVQPQDFLFTKIGRASCRERV